MMLNFAKDLLEEGLRPFYGIIKKKIIPHFRSYDDEKC
jgi:hypothetical protein